jgi:hypothetical protein
LCALSSSSAGTSIPCGKRHTKNDVIHAFGQVNLKKPCNRSDTWWTQLTTIQGPAALTGPTARPIVLMSHRLESLPAFHSAFKEECRALCLVNGDAALAASDYDKAIDLYSAAIDLNSASYAVFVKRSNAKSEKILWDDALLDAQKVRCHLVELLCSHCSRWQRTGH